VIKSDFLNVLKITYIIPTHKNHFMVEIITWIDLLRCNKTAKNINE